VIVTSSRVRLCALLTHQAVSVGFLPHQSIVTMTSAHSQIEAQGDAEGALTRIDEAVALAGETGGTGATLVLLVVGHLLRSATVSDDIAHNPCNASVLVEPKSARCAWR
jgi:hypothetical protein